MSDSTGQIIFLVLILLFPFFLNIDIYAGGSFEPILPVGDSHIGGEYRYYQDKGAPFLKTVYDWTDNKFFYIGGFDFYLHDYKSRISYLNWKNNSIPGYISEKGIKGIINIPLEIDRSITLSILSGETERLKGEYQLINYFDLNYQRNFFFSLDKYMDINFSILYGVDREGKRCSIYRFKAPQSYENFKINIEMGYINRSNLIRPYFSISNILKGYSNSNDKSKGNRMISISFEKQKQLFPDYKEFYMTLFKGAVFIEAADVLTGEEDLSDIDLKRSTGVGLIYTMGTVDFRIDGLVTSEGNWSDFETDFTVEYSF